MEFNSGFKGLTAVTQYKSRWIQTVYKTLKDKDSDQNFDSITSFFLSFFLFIVLIVWMMATKQLPKRAAESLNSKVVC